MQTKNLLYTIDQWIGFLDHYTPEQLRAKPTQQAWSIGQVFVHLLNETTHYLRQPEICLNVNDHSFEESSGEAKKMFLQNSFPDTKIEGPPSNENVQEPENKEQLKAGLLHLKKSILQLEGLKTEASFQGKTKHPGLGYFGATEWIQFANMHFQHHLRQKARIDAFLKTSAC